MRGEVHLDRDGAVFDVSLNDGQYSVHVVRTRFLFWTAMSRRLSVKHILSSDFASE
jgi:hypothetical protein